jgi:hypothetical protein
MMRSALKVPCRSSWWRITAESLESLVQESGLKALGRIQLAFVVRSSERPCTRSCSRVGLVLPLEAGDSMQNGQIKDVAQLKHFQCVF